VRAEEGNKAHVGKSEADQPFVAGPLRESASVAAIYAHRLHSTHGFRKIKPGDISTLGETEFFVYNYFLFPAKILLAGSLRKAHTRVIMAPGEPQG
jgi:hypothetical protein